MTRRKTVLLATMLAFAAVPAVAFGDATPGASPAGAFGGTDVPRPQGVDEQGRPLQPGNLPPRRPDSVEGPGPMITRTEVLARAESWLHPPVPYSQKAFRNGYRTDCSGYVSMVWRLDRNYWTGDLNTVGIPILFNDLKSGDMLLYHNPANPVNGSHVVLFDRWVGGSGGDFYMYEQTPPQTVRRKWSQTSNRTLSNYKPYRYLNAIDNGRWSNQRPGNADVDGDGRSDLVGQNESDTWVMTSTGTGFNRPAQWSGVPFLGWVANHLGDVNGDHRADLVGQNGSDTRVMLSTGTGFARPALWSSWAFEGRVANHLADVNGDHLADLVGQNESDTWVMLSTGTGFNGPALWSSVAFAGRLANHVGDINGDGRADLIGQSQADTRVMASTGAAFGRPTPWSSWAFAGRVANHG